MLDEAATAQRIADEGIHLPVLRRAMDRWFDLALIIDGAESMEIWADLIEDLRRLLGGLGAFRDVRLWHLRGSGPDIVLTPYRRLDLANTATAVQHRASELVDTSGRRLFLVLSDCSSAPWQNGAVGSALKLWGEYSPVGVAQVLPQRLWGRSHVAPTGGRLHSPGPGAANRRLRFVPHRRRRRAEESAGLPVPFFEMTPEWIGSWARLVAAGGDTDAAVAFVDASPARGLSGSVEWEAGDAHERIQAFRAAASPEAFRLVCHLATVPLELHVMRLVQGTMLPGSSPTLLAEILLGGLVTKSAEASFDFAPGVRDRLLVNVRGSDALRVIESVSRYLEQHASATRDFPAVAVLPRGTGGEPLLVSHLPFARIAAQVFARMGDRYRDIAERLAALQTEATAPAGTAADDAAAADWERLAVQAEAALLRFDRNGQRAELERAMHLSHSAQAASPEGSAQHITALEIYRRVLKVYAAMTVDPADHEMVSTVAGWLAENYRGEGAPSIQRLAALLDQAEALLAAAQDEEASAVADILVFEAADAVGGDARPYQAAGLAIQACLLCRRSDFRGGLDAAEQAVALFSDIPPDVAASFAEIQASALDKYVICLITAGMHLGALRHAQDSITVTRRLFGRRLALAERLERFNGLLLSVGRGSAAMSTAIEAVDLYRTLFDSDPDAWTTRLAAALEDLAHCLRANDQYASAEQAMTERLRMVRRSVGSGHAKYEELAMALRDVGNILVECGKTIEAVDYYDEAAEHWVRSERQDAGRALAADIRLWIASLLDAAGRHEEAAIAARRAIAAADSQGTSTPVGRSNESMALYLLARSLAAVGDLPQALHAARDCADRYRRRSALEDGALASPAEASALALLADIEHQTGDADKALHHMSEAVKIYREMVNHQVPASRADVAGALSSLARLEVEVGQPMRALATVTESIGWYEGLHGSGSSRFDLELARAFMQRCWLHDSLGSKRQASADSKSAARHYEMSSGATEDEMIEALRYAPRFRGFRRN